MQCSACRNEVLCAGYRPRVAEKVFSRGHRQQVQARRQCVPVQRIQGNLSTAKVPAVGSFISGACPQYDLVYTVTANTISCDVCNVIVYKMMLVINAVRILRIPADSRDVPYDDLYFLPFIGFDGLADG